MGYEILLYFMTYLNFFCIFMLFFEWKQCLGFGTNPLYFLHFFNFLVISSFITPVLRSGFQEGKSIMRVDSNDYFTS